MVHRDPRRNEADQCRLRRRIDPRLEAITPGERIALLEIGSDRVIRATVSGVKRTRHDYGYRYAIAFSDICAARSRGVKKIQGWQRRAKLQR